MKKLFTKLYNILLKIIDFMSFSKIEDIEVADETLINKEENKLVEPTLHVIKMKPVNTKEKPSKIPIMFEATVEDWKEQDDINL